MTVLSTLLTVLLLICSIFLICLVLIQRGKGGGLAGAFGGAGGSSAFGTKAGDVFTRITIATAGVWFLLAMLLVIMSNRGQVSAFDLPDGSTAKVPLGAAGGGVPGQPEGSGAAPASASTSTSPAGAASKGGSPASGAATAPPAAAGKTNPDLPVALEDLMTPEAPAPASGEPGAPATKPAP